jgi:hypothetical protein
MADAVIEARNLGRTICVELVGGQEVFGHKPFGAGFHFPWKLACLSWRRWRPWPRDPVAQTCPCWLRCAGRPYWGWPAVRGVPAP